MKEIALVCASLFTGAAFYIHLAEGPSRLQLPAEQLLNQWKVSFRRAFAMQAPLAFLSAILAFISFYQTRELLVLLGGIMMLLNGPFTGIFIQPINRKLLATQRASEETRELVKEWERRHAFRTAFGLIAIVLFLFS